MQKTKKGTGCSKITSLKQEFFSILMVELSRLPD